MRPMVVLTEEYYNDAMKKRKRGKGKDAKPTVKKEKATIVSLA